MLLRAIHRQPITNSESHGVISIGIKAWKKNQKKNKNKNKECKINKRKKKSLK